MPSLTVNGYDLSYAEQGTGAPVVLVHGTLGDQRSWAQQMGPLSAQYRVLALSLRHFWPEVWDGVGNDFTIAQHTADVAEFIRRIGAPVRLVGHSRGGHIAFRLAGAHPELIHQLVLAEPGGELDESLGGKAPLGGQGAVFRQAAEMIGAGKLDEGLAFFASHTGGPGAWDRTPEATKQRRRENARTLLGQINEQRKPYSLDSVKLLRHAPLLVGGAKSQPQFAAIMDAMQPHLPAGTERVTIPNSTHSLQTDNAAAFNAALLAFFAKG